MIMFDGKSVSKWTREELIKGALLIVAEGDAYGQSAKHPTTILTRQIIEQLIAELKKEENK